MNHRSSAIENTGALTTPRIQNAACLLLGLIAFASITGCTGDHQTLNARTSAAYQTSFSPTLPADQMLSDK
jgi:hypothetical protein